MGKQAKVSNLIVPCYIANAKLFHRQATFDKIKPLI